MSRSPGVPRRRALATGVRIFRQARREGVGHRRIAAAWVQLMSRLGYHRFLRTGRLGWARSPSRSAVAFRRTSSAFTRRPRSRRPGSASTCSTTPNGSGSSTLRLREEPSRLREGHGDRAADDRVLPGGLARRDARVDPREVLRWSDTVDSPFETISRDRFLDKRDPVLAHTRDRASAARIYFESHQSLDPDLRVTVPGPSPPTRTTSRSIRGPGGGTVPPHRAMAGARGGGHFPRAGRCRGSSCAIWQEGLAAVQAARGLRLRGRKPRRATIGE